MLQGGRCQFLPPSKAPVVGASLGIARVLPAAVSLSSVLFAIAPLLHPANAGTGGREPDAGGEYRVIVERNPFALRASAPAPAEPPPQTGAPPLEVKLTGMGWLPGGKKAFFMTGANGEPVRYHALFEGQQDGRLKLISIDLKTSKVEVLIDRVAHRLSFATHGFDLRFLSLGPQTPLEEIRFNEAHTRAHEEHERRELVRIEQERAEAEAELRKRADLVQHQEGGASPLEPPRPSEAAAP